MQQLSCVDLGLPANLVGVQKPLRMVTNPNGLVPIVHRIRVDTKGLGYLHCTAMFSLYVVKL